MIAVVILVAGVLQAIAAFAWYRAGQWKGRRIAGERIDKLYRCAKQEFGDSDYVLAVIDSKLIVAGDQSAFDILRVSRRVVRGI